ncbi:hypothetical protein F5B22DRAFT_635614 [Xylaria bambusicola]|uniref:uncharacterized protein n=1 Tax=Xylaria bambusicola TaxID=326684 RepID=UPI002007C726|nr:uncharacterized protein F5B22DRAFT_635614 [Xylaria bambusicola]KAI0517708.1 hypothetical protein F5B22DRAFT_635614 [Xylaria bambusicola]
MTQPRPSESVRAIIESAVPNIRLETVSIISTKRLLRAFKVKLANERTLLLKLLPPPSRLLRYEKWFVQSEAAVVEWLSQDACERDDKGSQSPDEKRAGKRPREAYPTTRRSDQTASAKPSSFESQLRRYLPTLIVHSSISTETSSAFCLFEPTLGDPISSLGKPLTLAERRSVDFQKGRLIRCIANVKSPNGRFGQVATVLEQPHVSDESKRVLQETKLDFDGADGWRKTFHLLLEGILRDAEDRAVTMSYELVRTTFRKFAHLLDAITTPRLVVIDGDEDEVVLVEEPEKVKTNQEEDKLETLKESARIKVEPEDSDAESQQQHNTRVLEITGLQDWSNCIFGDPLFATVFSHTTPEFEHGFRQINRDKDSDELHDIKEEDHATSSDEEEGSKEVKKEEEKKKQQDVDVDIIEDPENASTRILLYECYHATVAIVKQFYRPDADSSEREIAARRRLVAALAKLEHVDASESAGKRPRRPSDGDWPVKRPRGDTPVT